MHAIGRRFVDKYYEFHCLMFRTCLFSHIKGMEIILVYKTNMKTCGFDSVYSDRQP